MSAKVSENLKQRSNMFFVVLNDSGANLFKNSEYLYKEFLRRFDEIGFIALIKHEGEYDEENKREKVPHYHVAFDLKYNRVCSLANMLRIISDRFYCSENQISIEKATDMCSCVRYLIHLDNIDKQPFEPFDIVSNDYKLVGDYLSRIREIKDIKEVVKIAKECRYDTETIMLKIGSRNWKKYRTEFIDLKRDNKQW